MKKSKRELKFKFNLNPVGILLYKLGAIKLNYSNYKPYIRILHPIGLLAVIIYSIIALIISPFLNSSVFELFEDLLEYICLW